MVIAWTKQVGAKGYFRHESQMGHALGQSTTVAYVYWHQIREKKDAVYGLLFLLHDLTELRFTNPIRNPFTNPIRNPYPRHKYCTNLKMHISRTSVIPHFTDSETKKLKIKLCRHVGAFHYLPKAWFTIRTVHLGWCDWSNCLQLRFADLVIGDWRSIKVFWEAQSTSKSYL